MKDELALKEELEEYVKNVEKKYGDYISFVLNANFEGRQHTMLIEEEVDIKDIYEELSPLEKADLIDYFNMEINGRTD